MRLGTTALLIAAYVLLDVFIRRARPSWSARSNSSHVTSRLTRVGPKVRGVFLGLILAAWFPFTSSTRTERPVDADSAIALDLSAPRVPCTANVSNLDPGRGVNYDRTCIEVMFPVPASGYRIAVSADEPVIEHLSVFRIKDTPILALARRIHLSQRVAAIVGLNVDDDVPTKEGFDGTEQSARGLAAKHEAAFCARQMPSRGVLIVWLKGMPEPADLRIKVYELSAATCAAD